jgi:hypothetical protein
VTKERSDHAEAAALWRAVRAECPNEREVQGQLGE